MADVPVEDVTKLFEANLNLGAEEPPKPESNDECQQRSKALDLIKKRLKEHSNCFNWIKDKPDFENSALTAYKVISSKLDDIDMENDATEIKYNALDLISERYIQAFLAVYLKKSDKVDLFIDGMKTHLTEYFKDKKYIPLEYVEGFEYVLESLKIYWDVVSNDGVGVQLATLQGYLSSMPKFGSLTIKGQVAVMNIKQCFWGSIYRKDFDDQIEVLQKIIKMDPGYFEWAMYNYNVLRMKRRNERVFERLFNATAEETALILKAASLAPNNANVLVSKCLCLAEHIRSQSQGGEFILQFAGKRFMSAEPAVRYLRDEITRIEELDPTSVRVNISIAEIYSVILPYWIRDFPRAKICIERALKLHPNSSKANNRMGIYYLTVEKEKDYKLAEEYFRHALEADQRNFPALIELIQTYMRNLNENGSKIAELMEANLNNTGWSDDYLANLLYQKGMIHFMKNEFEEAVKLWIDAYLKNKDTTKNCVEKLVHCRNRYNWSQDNLKYSKMESVLQQTKIIDITTDGDQIRLELIKLVQAAEQARSSRGGGRGFRGGFVGGGRGSNTDGGFNAGGGFNSSREFNGGERFNRGGRFDRGGGLNRGGGFNNGRRFNRGGRFDNGGGFNRGGGFN